MSIKEWLNNEELPITIWENKYRYGNENFEEWLDRISFGNSSLRKIIKEKKFLFGGRTLANIGTDKKGSYSNCYSRGFVEDSLEDILKVNTDIALTFKAQGGQGVSLSKIRPKGCLINNTYESDGIIPFMEIFNTTTSSISQGGSRKGALLMSLDIWHKEADKFITIKSNEGKIEKANLSLEIDDKFMQCVEEYYKTGVEKRIEVHKEYGGNTIVYDVIPIKLYKLMMDVVYDWGEPGCIFTNKFRNYNIMEFCDNYTIETCNPCGEQPLNKNSACNLGSINLYQFVKNPFVDPEFDVKDFLETVKIAVRSLDRVIDKNLKNHALEEQKQKAIEFRNIGLGIMGLSDCLIALGIKYGSSEAVEFCKFIMKQMFISAVSESIEMAKEFGPFPGYNDKVWDAAIIKNNIPAYIISEGKKHGLRNCSLLSIAPTGSLSTFLNGISGGCEPYFAFEYNRTTKSLNGEEDRTYKQYAPIVNEYRKLYPNGDLPDYFVSSENIPWKERIDMQAALQYACDTAISSTVNLPENTPKEDIEQLYLYAWEQGLKGVTIFRSGCKRIAILSTKNTKQSDKPVNTTDKDSMQNTVVKKATDDCIGKKRTLMTGCGTLHLNAFFDKTTGNLLETYCSKGSQGGCALFMNGLSRMMSLAARGNISIENIVDQLKSAGTCPSYAVRRATKKDTSVGSSCPVAIGNALMDMYNEMQNELGYHKNLKTIPTNKEQNVIKCPECGQPLQCQEGCFSCKSCGYSKCG